MGVGIAENEGSLIKSIKKDTKIDLIAKTRILKLKNLFTLKFMLRMVLIFRLMFLIKILEKFNNNTL